MKPWIWLLTPFLLSLTTPAQAIIEVWGVWTWEPTEPLQLLVDPAGMGVPFTEAAAFDGEVTDGTIRIQLWVSGGNPDDPQPPAPVPDFPGEDIWLEAPGLVPCNGGTTADANTDNDGWFTFSRPLRAGGWNDPDGADPYFSVYVAGEPLREENGPVIHPAILVNSPDINGDRAVNLIDVGLFAGDLFGEYSFRSDFHWDGLLNLADLGQLARAMGHTCD